MNEEQDRVAATQWADDRIDSHLKGWGRPEWHTADVEDAYLAGLAAARAQTAELVEAAAKAEKSLVDDGHMGARWEPACAACQARKILTDALAKVTRCRTSTGADLARARAAMGEE